jgi:DNA-binding Xre family transcriptional regulator
MNKEIYENPENGGGIVHLFDLPRGTRVYVRLKYNTRKKLFFTAIKICKTYKSLANAIGTTDRNIFKLFNDVTKSISLDLLERFSEFLYSYTNDSSFKLETLEKDILYIRSCDVFELKEEKPDLTFQK